ncbi:hypothetical protein N7457_006432 [Penicillium paradoxum]|uniref:uncharacterized protein n=1 Tax=Penicillium paradoxum TaxID=176176 RepID=UPI0025471C2F|nr:uncharacterized protein N7457_006432 [Penicillium paradoxum]KAJ5781272.1 hypothetical protein N7457_006432 [Penicillium paradoxum]
MSMPHSKEETSGPLHSPNLAVHPTTSAALASTPEAQIITSPAIPTSSEMEKRRRVELSFRQMLAARQAEGQAEDEAWRHALVQWHRERGEHAAASTLATATITPEIPLGDNLLAPGPVAPAGAPAIHLAQPAINAAGENHILAACKPEDPEAQKRIRENTRRLVECGIVDKLSSEPASEPPSQPVESPSRPAGSSSQPAESLSRPAESPSRPAESSSRPEDTPAVDPFARVRAAHQRYMQALQEVEIMVRERRARREIDAVLAGAPLRGSGDGEILFACYLDLPNDNNVVMLSHS